MLLCIPSPVAIKRNVIKMTNVLAYRSRLSQGLDIKKHQEYKVDKAMRDGTKTTLKRR